MRSAELEDLLKPPTEVEVARALARFAADVRGHYRERLVGLYLFGSRARGDHGPESDADVAVVLNDGNWVSWEERWTLTNIAYGISLDSGLPIQPWPFSASKWWGHDFDATTKLAESARRDAVPIGAPL